jgi:hypothetical protein
MFITSVVVKDSPVILTVAGFIFGCVLARYYNNKNEVLERGEFCGTFAMNNFEPF